MYEMLSMVDVRDVMDLDAKQEARIDILRKRVIDLWETKTRRLWNVRASYAQLWTPPEYTQFLYTKLYPLAVLTLVEWDRGMQIGEAWTVNPNHYFYNPANGEIQLFRSGRWRNFVQGTMSGGYDNVTTILPMDIKNVLVTQLKYMAARENSDNVHIQEKSVQRSTTQFITGEMHPSFEAMVQEKMLRV